MKFVPSLKHKLKDIKRKGLKAFTLVELLLVIAILGILAGVIFVATRGTQELARDSRRASDLSQIRGSLQAYRLSAGVYPATDSDGISLEDDSENTDFVQVMKTGGYMSIIPKDPKYTAPTGDYTYKYISTTTDSYTLCAKSEAKGDYLCTSDSSVGTSRLASVPEFGGWGAGVFTCGASTVTFTYNGSPVTYGTVTSTNGECWMDRNLGATKVAGAYDDCASYPSNCSYGDLFQWGRADDGHQVRNSLTTTTVSSVDNPASNFIITTSTLNYDWRNPQNNNLWQGVLGINNPCPGVLGWRLPTAAEWETERASWSTNNNMGGFNSHLRLTTSGYREKDSGGLYLSGGMGMYWSSNVTSTPFVMYLGYDNSWASVDKNYRGFGFSVRCIKD